MEGQLGRNYRRVKYIIDMQLICKKARHELEVDMEKLNEAEVSAFDEHLKLAVKVGCIGFSLEQKPVGGERLRLRPVANAAAMNAVRNADAANKPEGENGENGKKDDKDEEDKKPTEEPSTENNETAATNNDEAKDATQANGEEVNGAAQANGVEVNGAGEGSSSGEGNLAVQANGEEVNGAAQVNGARGLNAMEPVRPEYPRYYRAATRRRGRGIFSNTEANRPRRPRPSMRDLAPRFCCLERFVVETLVAPMAVMMILTGSLFFVLFCATMACFFDSESGNFFRLVYMMFKEQQNRTHRPKMSLHRTELIYFCRCRTAAAAAANALAAANRNRTNNIGLPAGVRVLSEPRRPGFEHNEFTTNISRWFTLQASTSRTIPANPLN